MGNRSVISRVPILATNIFRECKGFRHVTVSLWNRKPYTQLYPEDTHAKWRPVYSDNSLLSFNILLKLG